MKYILLTMLLSGCYSHNAMRMNFANGCLTGIIEVSKYQKLSELFKQHMADFCVDEAEKQ